MTTLSSLLVLVPLLGVLGGADDHAPGKQDERTEPEFATVGELAPDFTLRDLEGDEVTLSDLRGRTVVLEWFNPECPFVVYAHEEGPLVDQAARLAEDGVVWLAINSGAEGKQGHGLELNREAADAFGMDYPLLIDEEGEVGRRYRAKTTPHMYVIDPEGTLVYAGAIDNAPRGRVAGDEHRNYVTAALADLAAEREVEIGETRPYGCSVKYAR